VKLQFSQQMSEQISNLMKIHPVGAELFDADKQTDWQDEVNSRFLQFCKCAS
jgi:hypothetical protein